MTSHTKAGVKLRRCVIENVWGFCAPDLLITTAVTRHWQSQVSLAVTLWLSGVVVNQTFTLGGVDVRACLFIDHCHGVFIHVKFT